VALHVFQRGVSIHAGHVYVQQYQVWPFNHGLGESLTPVPGLLGLETKVIQNPA
jgi:hypothetical protein